MACFDVHAPGRGGDGLAVEAVRSDLLEPFGTRVAVPLIDRIHAPRAPRRLDPVFDGRPLILAARLIGAVPTGERGAPAGSLAAERDAIRDALDMPFLGFRGA
jgi:hypothetical protein